MDIVDFDFGMVSQACALVEHAFIEEKKRMGFFPEFSDCGNIREEMEFFAGNGLGVAAVRDGKLIGFFGSYPPYAGVFDSPSDSGCWSPLHAHGFSQDADGKVMELLLQASMKKKKNAGAQYHNYTVFSHETKLAEIMWNYGFGKRCADAARVLDPVDEKIPDVFSVRLCVPENYERLRELRSELADHLAKSPAFIIRNESSFREHLARKESDGNLKTMGLFFGDSLCGFIDLEDGAENFISDSQSFLNIQGMFVEPEYRGKNLARCLVSVAVEVALERGKKFLGVDYETMNPTARAFWEKYFVPYTVSLVRRLD